MLPSSASRSPSAPPSVPSLSVPGKVWVPTRMQAQGLACGVFELFLGGAAGPGKSEYLVVAPLRWVDNPGFRAVLFRNSFPELQRSLLTKADKLYPSRGGVYRGDTHTWTFKSGATIELAYLERDRDVHRYQGAEYHFVGFDELPHFTEHQYRYMLSRIRGTDGVPMRMRATGNPDGPHLEWVRERFKEWIENRAVDGEALWYSPDGEVVTKGAPNALSRSYIRGKLSDNPYLPDNYVAQLMALDPVTRAKLLDGDWDACVGEGKLFHRDWWVHFDAAPDDIGPRCRAWDLGATVDGDPSRGVLLGRRPREVTPRWAVLDVATVRGAPHEVEALILATAARDGRDVTVCLPQDPGQAGLAQVQYLTRKLDGYRVEVRRPSEKKVTRWGPISSQVGARNVGLVRAPWTAAVIAEGHAAPDGPNDDILDALADAHSVLADVGEGDSEGFSRGGRRR